MPKPMRIETQMCGDIKGKIFQMLQATEEKELQK